MRDTERHFKRRAAPMSQPLNNTDEPMRGNKLWLSFQWQCDDLSIPMGENIGNVSLPPVCLPTHN